MIDQTAYALLFTVACVGISETAYLIRKRVAMSVPVCPLNGNCELVLTSKYNKSFGVYNDISGLFFYIFFAVMAAVLVIDGSIVNFYTAWIIWTSQLALVVASLMSLRFIYLQWQVIKAWCFWCLMSAGTVLLMDIIMVRAIF